MSDFEFYTLVAAGAALLFYLIGYYDGGTRIQPKGQHCKCFTCREENRNGKG